MAVICGHESGGDGKGAEGSHLRPQLATVGNIQGLQRTLQITKMTDAEIQTLNAAFSNAASIRQNGLYIAGEKNFTLRADDRSIYGKKACFG